MSATRTFPTPIPDRMAALPVNADGYPVPWFVAWLDADGNASERGKGSPDFRVIYPGAIRTAVRNRTCWLCGEALGAFTAFVIGPMCAINRVSSEPGSHLECANFAARACPFLANPNRRRRTNDLPEGHSSAAGCPIQRNPGVALVWSTRRFQVFSPDGRGLLFRLGDPERVYWWAEGREATRAEVLASVDSGYPLLLSEAQQGGADDVAVLERYRTQALTLLPAEVRA